VFEAEQDLKSVERFKSVLKKQLTSGVDYELPGATTDRNRGDVADVFVRDRARADIVGEAVKLVDAGPAFVNDIFDRRDMRDVLQRQNSGLGLELNRRCGDRCSRSKKGDEEHGVGRDKPNRKSKSHRVR
jgi:hypothetical protein